MRRFLVALQFLTILPIKISSTLESRDFGRSLLYFPLVGALIGAAPAACVFAFSFLPDLVLAALVLAIGIVITGGIHLDGFADTCDGFYGKKPKEKVLEIMRDSRIGAMGVAGIVCLLLLKFALLASIPRALLWKSLILMAAFSRWSQVLACIFSKYAREKGKAELFVKYADKKDALIGGVFIVALFFGLSAFQGMMLFVASLIPVFGFIYFVKKRIGGMTGDTIGATSEIAEVAVLLATVICLRMI